jgi:ATP-dependent Lon protease
VLPVLPLRDSVTFPDTLTPLAGRQERSIRLVNDVLGGDRMLAMVASRSPASSAGPDQDPRDRRCRHRRADAQGPRRDAADPRAGRLARAAHGLRAGQPYLVAPSRRPPDMPARGPELTALVRNVQQTFLRIIEDVPYLPEELQMAVANLDDPRRSRT